MKTYRFTLVGYHEIDIEAESSDEALTMADIAWDETFGQLGTFKEVEYMGVVNEEGKVGR